VNLVALLDAEPNPNFKGVALRQKLYNYAVAEVRRFRWHVGLWTAGEINTLYVLARYKTPNRLGLVRLAKALGFKERWYKEDFHTQHVVDAWVAKTSTPYDGDVVLYRATPHDREGFLDRWLPWPPAWKSIFGDRLTIETLKVPHAEMFRDQGSKLIGQHLGLLLDKLRERRLATVNAKAEPDPPSDDKPRKKAEAA
jgi:hypothetical protein